MEPTIVIFSLHPYASLPFANFHQQQKTSKPTIDKKGKFRMNTKGSKYTHERNALFSNVIFFIADKQAKNFNREAVVEKKLFLSVSVSEFWMKSK